MLLALLPMHSIRGTICHDCDIKRLLEKKKRGVPYHHLPKKIKKGIAHNNTRKSRIQKKKLNLITLLLKTEKLRFKKKIKKIKVFIIFNLLSFEPIIHSYVYLHTHRSKCLHIHMYTFTNSPIKYTQKNPIFKLGS